MTEKSVPPFQSYTSKSTFSQSPKNPSRSLYIVLSILLLVVVGIGAAQFFSSRSEELQDAAPNPIEFSEPTDVPPSPTPTVTTDETEEDEDSDTTPTPADDSETVDKATGLDRADLTIVILNGSGVSGAAAKLSARLEDLGYTVSSTGNADSSDYESTEISVKSVKKNFLNLLKKDLGADYTVGTTSSSYTGTGDAEIIIGSE